MRVVVAAHYASFALGGEALIPVQIFRQLRALGVDAWLVTHESGRAELDAVFAADRDRVRYSASVCGGDWLFRMGERLPPTARALAWSVTQIERQIGLRREVRRLVSEVSADLVHQPISVSPSIPSLLRKLGAPVVIGPLNGGMDLPPALGGRDSWIGRLRRRTRPALGRSFDRAFPARREAARVLVANNRTRKRLTGIDPVRVEQVSDIGVDLTEWPATAAANTDRGDENRFRVLYVGRLVRLKAVDLLMEALAVAQSASGETSLLLEIAGDGPERAALHELASRLTLSDTVKFRGWLNSDEVQQRVMSSDVVVLPSLAEAGGVVVVEAMAAGRPVVVADWGGPAETVDDTCGMRIPVGSRTEFVQALADALLALAADPVHGRELGAAGRRRVEQRYDWSRIATALLSIYRDVLDEG